jgi:hypothetical protein
MRSAVLLAVLIVATAPGLAAAHVVRHTAIPQDYQGTWATSAASCGAEQGAIVLSAKTYVGPSGNCTVVYVDETAGTKGSIYSARLACSSAAAGAKKFANLIIRPDKDGISVGPTFATLVSYQRCLANGGGAKP